MNTVQRNQKQEPPAVRAWRLAASVSGFFAAFVGMAMLIGFLNSDALDPLKSPEMKEQKEKLRADPKDEKAKQRIRELDLQIRQRYFSRLTQRGSGVYLLLGGAAVFVFAFSRYTALTKLPPRPAAKPDPAAQIRRAATRGRWAVAASGAVIGGFLFLLTLGFATGLPRKAAELDKLLGGDNATAAADSTPVNDAAPPEEYNRNWPRFLGPNGTGQANYTNVPGTWDVVGGAGVAWKIPSPAPGFNSPIIWNDRIYFSGGEVALHEVLCLDLKTGQLVWKQPVAVPGSPNPPPEIPESSGIAAPTMATDGRRVYALFANGDLAAFTLDGRAAWSKSLGELKNAYGHATSLVTWRDRLILQLDQGEVEENRSKIYALDGRTGAVVWQKPRKAGASWATPLVFETGGKGQVVASAVPLAVAYATADGAELWRADCLNGEVTPTAIFAGGFVIVPSPSEKFSAIRPDGQGDVSKTKVAWTTEDNVPDVTSPCSNGELLFSVTTGGMLTCFEVATGKKLWEQDLENEFHASPVLAGNKVYLFSQKGAAVVVEAARECKAVQRLQMPDAFHATPAIAQDRLVVRGMTNVWCIGGPAGEGKMVKP